MLGPSELLLLMIGRGGGGGGAAAAAAMSGPPRRSSRLACQVAAKGPNYLHIMDQEGRNESRPGRFVWKASALGGPIMRIAQSEPAHLARWRAAGQVSLRRALHSGAIQLHCLPAIRVCISCQPDGPAD